MSNQRSWHCTSEFTTAVSEKLSWWFQPSRDGIVTKRQTALVTKPSSLCGRELTCCQSYDQQKQQCESGD